MSLSNYLVSQKGSGKVACTRARGLRCSGRGNTHPFQTLSETLGTKYTIKQ